MTECDLAVRSPLISSGDDGIVIPRVAELPDEVSASDLP